MIASLAIGASGGGGHDDDGGNKSYGAKGWTLKHQASPSFQDVENPTASPPLPPPPVLLSGRTRDMTVVLRALDRSAIEDTQQVIGIESYHMHPEYNDVTVSNDILLLKLVHKATLNKNVQIIPLPTSSSDLPNGTPCSLAG
ncbi:mast cell protease 1A-like [Podarcis lilfordi]|uniref:Mast cell protease 1A-like n=1 Tax=Podarcis lilfordi TaxID=74358 RepID=A0AA35LND8_9SAUR|nr:mast cell protease 1A-like [Podarcis lilfordi]